MLFQQTTAPTGWTKGSRAITEIENCIWKCISDGGSNGFTTRIKSTVNTR